MSEFTFQLDFWESGQNLTLTRTVFTQEGCEPITTTQGGEEHNIKWLTGVIAMSIAVVSFRLGKLVLTATRPSPEASLYDAITKANATIYWPEDVFGKKPLKPGTLKPCGRIKELFGPTSHALESGLQQVTLTLNEKLLHHKQILITRNGKPVKTGEGLEVLHGKLNAEFTAQALHRVAGRKQLHWELDLQTALGARYSTPERPIEFHVVREREPLAPAAAWVLHQTIRDCLREHGEVKVGVTGGVTQAEVPHHMPADGKVVGSKITVSPMNNMVSFRHPERSAGGVALALAACLGGTPRGLPASHERGEYAEYTKALDVALLSAGERSRSYITEQVRHAKPVPAALCRAVVGDINGHLVDSLGGPVRCPPVEKILKKQGLYCPLDLDILCELAADPSRRVIAVLSDEGFATPDASGGQDATGASKCGLARACLSGGYANVYVIGKVLAGELLASPPHAALRVRRRIAT